MATRFTNNDKDRIELALFLAFSTLEIAAKSADDTNAAQILHEMENIIVTRDRVRALPLSEGSSVRKIGF